MGVEEGGIVFYLCFLLGYYFILEFFFSLFVLKVVTRLNGRCCRINCDLRLCFSFIVSPTLSTHVSYVSAYYI